MKKGFIIAILIIAAIVAYIFAGGQHTEDLGELEIYTYDKSELYCVYQIVSASPADANAMKIGSKVCIVCREGWPNVEAGGNQICPSRIKYVSASGVYTYEAKLFDRLRKECHECTNGDVYYNKP